MFRIVVAAKFSSDFFFKNSFYAKVGGISTSELNELELEFLFRIHFVLFVKESTFKQYHAHLLMYSSNSSVKIPRQLRIYNHTRGPSNSCAMDRCGNMQHVIQDKAQYSCSVAVNLNVPQNPIVNVHSRCSEPFRSRSSHSHSRYHFHNSNQTQNQNHNYMSTSLNHHRRHHSDMQNQPPSFNTPSPPYAKRHRTSSKKSSLSHTMKSKYTTLVGTSPTSTNKMCSDASTDHSAFINKSYKSSVTVGMDMWFPKSATTVAAR
mmetsp:Transcript_21233/g.29743  ORF Transcript_21233/g.29743 Transcript_21233/m.29743 type:complete len:262 (-) Transcript_21233:909-1694(-)